MVLNLFKTLASKNEVACTSSNNNNRSPSRCPEGRSSSGGAAAAETASSSAADERIPTMMHPLHVGGRKTREGGLRLPEVFASRVLTGSSPLGQQRALQASLSAPSSPATRSSIPRGTIPARCPTSLLSGVSVRPPAPNICVQKGRIEFVRSDSAPSAPPAPAPSAPPVTSPTSPGIYSVPVPSAPPAPSSPSAPPAPSTPSPSAPPTPSAPPLPSPSGSKSTGLVNYSVDKNRPAVMGSKIFRPQLLRKGEQEESATGSGAGVKHFPKWKPAGIASSSNYGESMSFRERSASPKLREPTPPRDSAEVPLTSSVRKAPRKETIRPLTSSLSDPAGTDAAPVMSTSSRSGGKSMSSSASSASSARSPHSVIRPAKSREVSPSPSAADKTAASKKEGAKSAAGASPATKSSAGSIPVPVSPNLVRWRAKLSRTDGAPTPVNCVGLSASKSAPVTKATASAANKIVTPVKRTIITPITPVTPITSPSAPPPAPPVQSKSDAAQVPAAAAEEKPAPLPEKPEIGADSCPQQVQQSPADSGDGRSANATLEATNQMQLLNLHYEVKRLEEMVKSLLPLRHQQNNLVQSYEQRLTEAQSRISALEAENQVLRDRLQQQEAEEAESKKLVTKLQSDSAALAVQHEQQRVLFDKCLDDIANHVVQALISQKNLQGECRRLRSQVSDLEQRNVALNLLLTQSLRDSMIDQKSKENGSGLDDVQFGVQADGLVQKSASYDCNMETEASGGSAGARDSFCSVVSDSEIRAYGSIFSDPTARPLVSKDANWMLSAQGHGLSSLSPQSSPLSGRNPVERAEKLLAVLKHRLFSAQLNSYKHPADKRRSKKRHEEIRHSLPPVHQHWEESCDAKDSGLQSASLPARPNTLSFLPSKNQENEEEDPSGSESAVRVLVQVLEKRVVSLPSPAADIPAKSPRPPVAPAAGLRTIRTTDTDSPASKDEGYSTMSSDVQVDSSSSSSSFIASGCSSPATLRRGGANGTLLSTTRSLPMAKRKPIASADPHRQPNRSISLQETHSGAGLEEVKEEENSDASSSAHPLTFPPQSATVMAVTSVITPAPPVVEKKHQALTRPLKREWPGVQLGTLCEDWSPSSADSDAPEDAAVQDPAATSQADDKSGLQKWTSDSKLYKAEADAEETNWKTLQLKNRAPGSGHDGADPTSSHPLRRSRAQIRLVEEIPSPSVRINYSQHEMEDWILRSSSDEMIHRHFNRPDDDEDTTTDTTASAVHSGDEDDASTCGGEGPSDVLDILDEDALFGRQLSSPECGNPADPGQESGNEQPDEGKMSTAGSRDDVRREDLETEFTRDFYRLVKFESSRSLASSEKFDHDQEISPSALPPPDRQVALQTVLDFIAEQQRYCQERESSDKQATRHVASSTTPELPHPSLLAASADGLKRQDKETSSSLLQLRHLIPDAQDEDSDGEDDGEDEDDDLGRIHRGFSTNWMPVRSKAEHIDLNNLEVRAAILDNFLESSSSSSDSSPCPSCAPSTPESPFPPTGLLSSPSSFRFEDSSQGYGRKMYLPTTWERPLVDQSSISSSSLASLTAANFETHPSP